MMFWLYYCGRGCTPKGIRTLVYLGTKEQNWDLATELGCNILVGVRKEMMGMTGLMNHTKCHHSNAIVFSTLYPPLFSFFNSFIHIKYHSSKLRKTAARLMNSRLLFALTFIYILQIIFVDIVEMYSDE